MAAAPVFFYHYFNNYLEPKNFFQISKQFKKYRFFLISPYRFIAKYRIFGRYRYRQITYRIHGSYRYRHIVIVF